MSELRDQIAQALATHEWNNEGKWGKHQRHNFLGTCGICQGDVNAIADVVMTIVGPELDRLEQAVRVTLIATGWENAAQVEQDQAELAQAQAVIARVRALAEQWRYQQDRKRAAEELRAEIERGAQ